MEDALPCAAGAPTTTCRREQVLVQSVNDQRRKRIMAKGQMKAKKEVRKPKKDAKKPAAAPALKAAPVMASRQKEK
ncbi:hypothetical protein [Mesorhizobium sp. YM1C-6-2]|jgi:hypothetical protein|uniref:hypothetical protein n=1 Tax=Mesorhizobium sp. YM1C-6-2 TaxID=1827501 RepID=UPI0016041729|nr:hypothetical protein [Mesorhizobium sp. YM1C-6-2]